MVDLSAGRLHQPRVSDVVHPLRVSMIVPTTDLSERRLGHDEFEHGTFVEQEDHPQRLEVLVELLDPSCRPMATKGSPSQITPP